MEKVLPDGTIKGSRIKTYFPQLKPTIRDFYNRIKKKGELPLLLIVNKNHYIFP